MADYKESTNLVFANCSEENAVSLLTFWEIAESYSADATMRRLKHQSGYAIQLVQNSMILCKDGKLTPKDLQDRAVAWYHHYLQHPGSTHLKETLCSAMNWKGMQHTI
jgi:hypothetical protein